MHYNVVNNVTVVSDNDLMQKCCMLTKVLMNITQLCSKEALVILLLFRFIWNVHMQLLYIKLSAVIYATLLNFQSPFSQFRQ